MTRPAVVRTIGPATAARVHVVVPSSFNDVQEVGDRLKANQPVILNLQAIAAELRRRLVDFSSGLAYATGGTMARVADRVYLLTPILRFRPRPRGSADVAGKHRPGVGEQARVVDAAGQIGERPADIRGDDAEHRPRGWREESDLEIAVEEQHRDLRAVHRVPQVVGGGALNARWFR